jgi:hypothetical protein
MMLTASELCFMDETGVIPSPAPTSLATQQGGGERALVAVAALVPAQVFAPGGVDALLTSLEAEVRAQAGTLDASTPKGRKAVASLAYKVAQSKTALDDMGKDLAVEWKRMAGLVDADRRLLRDRLDTLKAEVRAPLDAFEAEEARRIADHEAAIAAIEALANTEWMTAEAINERIWSLPTPSDRPWQEFAVRAERAIEATRDKLVEAHRAAVRREADAARVAAENEARRLEHEARIAANARAVALMEAEQQAALEREAAARAIAEAEAKARAAEVAAEQAVARERKRQQDDAQAAADEAARRERHAAHRQRIHREALHDMMTAAAGAQTTASVGMLESLSKAIITAIAKSEIRHVTITY